MARDVADLGLDAATSAGLVYVDRHDTGLRRVAEQGMVGYLDPEGRPAHCAATLERIHRLAIPPAWTEVWICADPRGHVQAVGRDARGRLQYRYHPDWRAERDRHKFERVCAFGRALPALRARVEADLARPGLPREKVVAAVVRLLEITLIRIGNDEYARANRSFGLTTLRKRHVTLSGVGAIFEFRGKAGVARRTGFRDRRLARVLRRCQDLPGQRLFQYLDADGTRRHVESADVNAYLRGAAGDDFSAKDFRTWAGTLAAARALRLSDPAASPAQAKKTVATCVKAVAGLLGNTPAVCRACYIHPCVFDAFAAGALSPALAGENRGAETALLRLLHESGAC
ncbi:MAG TPA: DNA topoisomerase IB [Caulobacteraceae bacterium]|nr:DNA topoisomerase IB [Caulobacteraceae bacterium]